MDDIRNRWLEYGDPPNIHCGRADPIMTSDPVCAANPVTHSAFGVLADDL